MLSPILNEIGLFFIFTHMKIQDLYSLFLKSTAISTDSREIVPGSIFFALKGENFNGNQFVEQAINEGAKYAITDEKEREYEEKGIFYFDDCLKTLQELAKYHRIKSNIPVISLTGSNGKTTTKELISTVLGKQYKIISTKGNLNNHIGVPLTLLSIKNKHELAVVEMGANHQKEIEFLCSIAQPDFGYITNFGKAHLEGFGSVEGVIKGKSELYQYLKANSKTAFVNCNDSKQMELTEEIQRITFGNCLEADFIFEYNQNPNGQCPGVKYNSFEIQSKLTGNYNASNVAIAIAIGLYFKVPIKKIKEAVENYHSENNRSQIIEREKYKIVLDAYNANPSSMEAALRNFDQIEITPKRIILGDMFELGEASQTEHQKIADLATGLKIDEIFLIGKYFNKTENNDSRIKTFVDRRTAIDFFSKHSSDFKLLLIKGSRGMALEKLLDIF